MLLRSGVFYVQSTYLEVCGPGPGPGPWSENETSGDGAGAGAALELREKKKKGGGRRTRGLGVCFSTAGAVPLLLARHHIRKFCPFPRGPGISHPGGKIPRRNPTRNPTQKPTPNRPGTGLKGKRKKKISGFSRFSNSVFSILRISISHFPRFPTIKGVLFGKKYEKSFPWRCEIFAALGEKANSRVFSSSDFESQG